MAEKRNSSSFRGTYIWVGSFVRSRTSESNVLMAPFVYNEAAHCKKNISEMKLAQKRINWQLQCY